MNSTRARIGILERTGRLVASRWLTDANTILILVAVAIGVLVGLGAIAFRWLLDFSARGFFGADGRALFGRGDLPRWLLPLVPMAGGLLVGPIIHFWAREAKGHGVPEVMSAVALRAGVIRRRVAAAKAVASAICIGSGGSAGREGPIVQIGSAIGSGIGQATRMSADRMKVFVACGSAAGIAAVFRAPVGGVLFAIEVILGDFAVGALAPVLIAAVMASIVASAAFGNQPVFQVGAYTLASVREIPLYGLLGIACGILAALFIRILYWSEDRFDAAALPSYLKPALGGLLLGILAVFPPQVLSDGYPTITHALRGEGTVPLLFLLALAKVAATSITLGSGNSGGIFAPSLFMGACLGGAMGGIFHEAWPTVAPNSGAYATVGMAALVAGTTRASLTSMLIIFEMTNDYRVILPLMVSTALAVIVSGRIARESIYTLKLARRGIHLHAGRATNLMALTKVESVMRLFSRSIARGIGLDETRRILEESSEPAFPVVDEEDRLTGVLSRVDLTKAFEHVRGSDLAGILTAQDVAVLDPLVVHPDQTLNDAMLQLGKRDLRAVPVVERADRKLLGMVHRRDVIAAYNRILLREQGSEAFRP
jgi:CIC family chloride channel protein